MSDDVFPWEQSGDEPVDEAPDVEQSGVVSDGESASDDAAFMDGATAEAGAAAGIEAGPAAEVEAEVAGASQPVASSVAPVQVEQPSVTRDAVAPRGRPIARKEYYSIGEVSDLVGLPAHVLRYWESQFPVLNPTKNRSGNRAYQRKEIRLILLVKQLLYEDKYTVEGAKSRLDQLRKGGELAGASAGALDRELVDLLRQDVAALQRVLAGTRG